MRKLTANRSGDRPCEIAGEGLSSVLSGLIDDPTTLRKLCSTALVLQYFSLTLFLFIEFHEIWSSHDV